MSEYWVSTPKYWCKHCSTFVVDTPLGRKNHDATGKHQGALKRFLRDIHRSSEREASATEHAKREVERLNALVSGKPAPPSVASSSDAMSVGKPEQKKGERWGVSSRGLTEVEKKKQMKELEALGVAMPEEFRGDLALPGEWSTVVVEEPREEKSEKEKLQEELAELKRREKEDSERKRKWEEMDEDERALKGFKVQTMAYPGANEYFAAEDGVGADVKPLTFNFGKRKAKTEQGDPADVKVKEATEDELPMKKEDGGEATAKINQGDGGEATGAATKKEDDSASPPAIAAETGPVFKKRKPKNIRKK